MCDTLDTDRGSERQRVTSRSGETPRHCVASERSPATTTTTTTSDKPVTTLSRRRPDDSSPRLRAAPVIHEGDVPDVRPQQRAHHHKRVGDTEHVQPPADDYAVVPVRRPSRRRRYATLPPPVNDSVIHQQPQSITSIHFDSGEIDSTLQGSDSNDDGVTWGLHADRCVFETTFPVHDRRRATRARLPAPLDDANYTDDEQDLNWQRSDADEEHADQQRPRQRLKRWRTLENIRHSSMDSIVVADDDGSGDTEGRWMPKRHTSPEHSHRYSTKRRSTSMPNRSIVGFYVDSDWDSTEESSQDETVDEYGHRHRGDGAGDRRSNDDGPELLELEVGSEDWLEMQRDIYRFHTRAEQMFDPPSPRKTILRSNNSVSSRINQQPVRTLTTTGVAGPTVGATKKNAVPQLHQSAVPATNSASEKLSPKSDTNENQVQPNSLSFDNRAQTLLLALFVTILLAGFIYKNIWTSTPAKVEPPPPETPWLDTINAYMTDVTE